MPTMNSKQAKRIAFGSIPSKSLNEYYSAWQWIYDNKVELSIDDLFYLDKLICDGNVKVEDTYYD